MASVQELWSYRSLIANLTSRELKGKYKRSLLGWLWSLINPATTLAIYTVVFGTLLKVDVPLAGNGHTKSFAMFLFAALVMWNFFNSVITGSMAALISAGPLLKKVYFPPECPPLATTVAALFQAGFEIAILLIVLIVVGNVSWTIVLAIPILALLVLFSVGVAFVLSLFNVYFRDVNYLTTIGTQLLFYATPIIYPFSLVSDRAPSWIVDLVTINPLTQFVGAARDVFYLQQVPSLGRWFGLLASAAVSLVVGSFVFRRGARDVAEEL
jgi:ABC-type polysaccharide/polyol phosphate export permease